MSKEKLYKVIENDRMFRKQRVVAAKLLHKEAVMIQMLRYLAKEDPFMQFAVEAEITKQWGEDV